MKKKTLLFVVMSIFITLSAWTQESIAIQGNTYDSEGTQITFDKDGETLILAVNSVKIYGTYYLSGTTLEMTIYDTTSTGELSGTAEEFNLKSEGDEEGLTFVQIENPNTIEIGEIVLANNTYYNDYMTLEFIDDEQAIITEGPYGDNSSDENPITCSYTLDGTDFSLSYEGEDLIGTLVGNTDQFEWIMEQDGEKASIPFTRVTER